jgi:fructoselysine-6-P-deglycase FrlB-like protein
MARPYASEMAKLSETFYWAANENIQMLCDAVRTAGLSPLRAIGSGGSLTAAHALAAFHQYHTGRMAAVATPLEALNEPLEKQCQSLAAKCGGATSTSSPRLML